MVMSAAKLPLRRQRRKRHRVRDESPSGARLARSGLRCAESPGRRRTRLIAEIRGGRSEFGAYGLLGEGSYSGLP